MYTPHLHMTRSLKNDWLGWVQELCPCSFLPRSWTNPVWLVTIHQSGLSSQLSSCSSHFPCPAANLAWHQLVKWLHLHLQQSFKTIHIKRNRKMFLFLNLQNFARVLVKYGIKQNIEDYCTVWLGNIQEHELCTTCNIKWEYSAV